MMSRLRGVRWERLWIYALAALPAWAALALAVAPLGGHLLDGVTLLVALAALAWALSALRGEGLGKWVPRATAEGLGAIRAWIAAILLASVLWEDLASTAYLPRGMLQFPGQWLVELLHDLPIGFDRFLASAPALLAFETAAALLLAMAMVGLFTRWTVPAAAVAYLLFASILRSYAWGRAPASRDGSPAPSRPDSFKKPRKPSPAAPPPVTMTAVVPPHRFFRPPEIHPP